MPKMLLKCHTCGTDFHRKPCLVREGLNTFCSRLCYHEYDKGTKRIGRRVRNSTPIEERAQYREVECRYCKKEFYRYRGHISPHAHIYCNRDCRTKYMRENPTPKAPPKQHEYNCLHCGGKFQRPVSPKSKFAPKYCSPKCLSEKGLITLNCNSCGTEFKKRIAVLRYANKIQGTENVYCSAQCVGVATGNLHRGTTGRINKRDPDKYETLSCDNCGGAFNKLKKAYAPQKKVCSKECKAELTAKALEARK